METKDILIPRVRCMASEVGKIVANKCLDKNISLNTLKLEKLLILMQIEYIRETKKSFFQESIIVPNRYNTKIKEVDEDFLPYAVGMDMIPTNTRFCEYICLLDQQLKVVNSIINTYGNLDAFELEETPDIQLIHKISEELNTQRIQPSLIFYGLGRFSSSCFEKNATSALLEKAQVKLLRKNRK